MKKSTLLAQACIMGFGTFLSFVLTGCFKDHCTKTYSYYIPVYQTTEQVKANVKSNSSIPIELPGKIYMYGNYIFLNEMNRGVHIINNSNPASPQNIAFINIPGNLDLAVKGNYLYADSYTDLVTIDISNPEQAKAVKFTENAFPPSGYAYLNYGTDSAKVLVNYIKRDTTIDVDCSQSNNYIYCYDVSSNSLQTYASSSSKSASPFGIGGSMARFAIADQYLYTVTWNALNVFGISSPQNPSHQKKVDIGWNIETIFPFQNKLFIGSSAGMFVYSISNGGNPVKESEFEHVRSCDPVIADNKYAYVTLRSGTACQGFANQLDVLDISDINKPSLLKTYGMTNPHGLSKDGSLLFICDGRDGLKVYNASNVNDLKLLSTISGIETFDVIAHNKVALVVATDGLYQYDYSDPSNLKLLSKITLQK